MGFTCGIVGLPNVGKSTLFNALTKAGIEASNYPFCTIDPNVGIVPVPDSRLDQLVSITNPQKTLPTTIEFVDIAGLVSGASKGEGLGNQFLAHIRETDAIAQVVRCFDDPNVVHVAGKVSPLDDLEVIHTELALADLQSVEKALQKVRKLAKSGDKQAKQELGLFEKLNAQLSEGHALRLLDFSEEELAITKHLHLLTTKPVLYVANIAEDGFENNPYLTQVQEYAASQGAQCVAICASIESELSNLEDDEKQEFLQAYGLKEPGLNRLIRTGYELLKLLTFFTAGPKEVRAWTVTRGATAPQAAGQIHTDFERGFIRAEVIGFDDYVTCKGESGARDAGKLRSEGKEYIVQDGDVMHFRFNV